MSGARSERGQALVTLLAVMSFVLLGAGMLAAHGATIGARTQDQRVADLAAVSGAHHMRSAYPRLFEPAQDRRGRPNPRHLEVAEYEEIGRRAAIGTAIRNGERVPTRDVSFPGSGAFGPTQIRVTVRGNDGIAPALAGGVRRISVHASAAAELSVAGSAPGLGQPGTASGGGYDGPLAYRMGRPMRPDTARAFDGMAAAARRSGIALSVNSGFRSDAEQARLFAAHPDPKWVARPGTSLHRFGTELDLGPPAAYGWLAQNAPRFGFRKRYAWEPWHFGFSADPRDVPAGLTRESNEPPDGDDGHLRGMPGFVPGRFRDPIAAAALRWNVPMNLLAAQLYAESGFNPFARSPAGALGIAQFMPGTARTYGLGDPFDPGSSIQAQAHLMSDLLREFHTAPLALAAYNAGAGAVHRFGGMPPFAETRAYVARIMGMLGGAGEFQPVDAWEVRLVP